LELASGGVGALLFSQCNVLWRIFVWAGGSGFQSFFLLFVFFCQVWLLQESILFGLLKVSQAHLEPAVGRQQQAAASGQQCGGGSLPVYHGMEKASTG
jgi:hypothetical protein